MAARYKYDILGAAAKVTSVSWNIINPIEKDLQ